MANVGAASLEAARDGIRTRACSRTAATGRDVVERRFAAVHGVAVAVVPSVVATETAPARHALADGVGSVRARHPAARAVEHIRFGVDAAGSAEGRPGHAVVHAGAHGGARLAQRSRRGTGNVAATARLAPGQVGLAAVRLFAIAVCKAQVTDGLTHAARAAGGCVGRLWSAGSATRAAVFRVGRRVEALIDRAIAVVVGFVAGFGRGDARVADAAVGGRIAWTRTIRHQGARIHGACREQDDQEYVPRPEHDGNIAHRLMIRLFGSDRHLQPFARYVLE